MSCSGCLAIASITEAFSFVEVLAWRGWGAYWSWGSTWQMSQARDRSLRPVQDVWESGLPEALWNGGMIEDKSNQVKKGPESDLASPLQVRQRRRGKVTNNQILLWVDLPELWGDLSFLLRTLSIWYKATYCTLRPQRTLCIYICSIVQA